MNIKLLLQHGTSIYDATPILEGRVEVRKRGGERQDG